ncbi:MAG: tRNA lysidine(34) synthetase TilS [Ruminococcaceae bacterium]|nr:tRNA lysidine(34) synthetase TilS [Oscillospiraceae bacterium]
MKMSQMNQVKVDFLNKICSFFDDLHINLSEKNLCVCLSGGADSVSLLCAMDTLKEKYGFSLYACHFNHMIRGNEADRDESFCKDLCEKLHIKIYCGRDDVPAYAKAYKLSMEEAARECRYAFFKRISENNHIDYCLTAHNMNDDAETLLFNLIRGSGLNGATAISPIKDNLLRPLLKIKRSEIENFLEEIGQNYIFDSTNASVEYTRNYIRNVLMPCVEKINPSVVESLSRYIDNARIDREYFEETIENIVDSDLRSLHKSLRTRIIYKKYKDFCGCIINSYLIAAIDNALFSEKRSVIPVSDKTEAVVGNGKVDFYSKDEVEKLEFDETELHYGENSMFGDRVKVVINSKDNKNTENVNKISTTEQLSFDNIKGTLRVRNRRVGDKIKIHGINKSLKKLFIDKKIPKEYRNIIPIILDEEGILYVPFVGISDRAFLKNSDSTITITTLLNTVETERWNKAYEEKK